MVLGLDVAILDDEEAEQLYRLASGLMLRRRVLRKVIDPGGAGIEVIPGSEDVVTYYAKSIEHHFDRKRAEDLA